MYACKFQLLVSLMAIITVKHSPYFCASDSAGHNYSLSTVYEERFTALH